MQHLARGGEIGDLFATLRLLPAIGRVSQNGKSKMLKVDADLMGSAGEQQRFNEGCAAQTFQHAKTGTNAAKNIERK